MVNQPGRHPTWKKVTRFEHIRLSLNYDLATLYRDRNESTLYGGDGGYANDMIPHVMLDVTDGSGKTQRELILGGINQTPAEHITDWLNRNIKARQSVVSIMNTSGFCYDILVENHV